MREALEQLNVNPEPAFEQGVWLRALARLTTEPWDRGLPADPEVVAALDGVTERGGMLRQALARNFVLWRTYVCRGETRGIIVLPGPGIRLSHRESIAVAVDLLRASGATAAPDGFAARLGGAATHGVVLHAAERKIQAALARGGLSD